MGDLIEYNAPEVGDLKTANVKSPTSPHLCPHWRGIRRHLSFFPRSCPLVDNGYTLEVFCPFSSIAFNPVGRKGLAISYSCRADYASVSGQDLYEVHEIQTNKEYSVYMCVITSVRVRSPLQKVPSFMHCTSADFICICYNSIRSEISGGPY